MAYNSFINKQAGTQSPKFEFKKDNNNAAIVSGDGLGQFNFMGFDGVTYLETSRIISTSSGTIAANRIGSNLEFYTHPDSVVASTQRMVISSAGNVTINSPESNASLTINDPVTSTQVLRVISSKTGAIDVETTAGASLRVIKTSDNVNPPDIYTFKRRTGGTISVGDIITRVIGYGQTASTDQQAGYILMNAEKVNSGPDFVSGHWYFATTDLNGANGNRLEIAANGNVTIAAPTSGTALTIVAGGETITAGDLTLSNGNINLTTTTSAATGVILAGANRFIHNYGTTNTFVGVVAGNFTLTGTNNVAFGTSAASNISSGTHNTAIGAQCLTAVSIGGFNTGLGQAYQSLTSGTNNIGIGYGAGLFLTTGSRNIILGNYNTNGGQNYTSNESNNICIGNAGVLGQSNAIRIGISGAGLGQQDKCFIAGIDGVNVGSVAKVITMASDQLGTATITAGAGISVTPTANTITIASTNGIAWTEVTVTSQAMAVDSGYIANNAGLVTLTLPATAVVGDRVRIAGKGAGGWRCGQNAGQTINFGNTATTAGVAGYIDSTNQYDALELLCITANTTWVALSSVGNLNVV
jgi:hypothetical protein